MTDEVFNIPRVIEDRKDGGQRILVDCDDHPEFDGAELPISVVTIENAISYIAHGRYGGPAGERDWNYMTPRQHAEGEVYLEGLHDGAKRVLERAIRRGDLIVYETSDSGDAGMLWRVDPAAFASGVAIYGRAKRGADDCYIQAETLLVWNALFDATAITGMADGEESREAIEPPAATDAADSQPKRRRKKPHTRDYGTPLGFLASRLLALDRDEATSIGTESLGVMLAEEYRKLEMEPPSDEATVRQMATGMRKGLFGMGT